MGADLTGVNFDGKVIKGYDFSNLSGVTINLDMVPDKNLSKTKIKQNFLTRFDGYIYIFLEKCYHKVTQKIKKLIFENTKDKGSLRAAFILL